MTLNSQFRFEFQAETTILKIKTIMKIQITIAIAAASVLFIGCSSAKPESVISNGEVYEVNGKAILKNGENVTESLDKKDRSDIFNLRDNQVKTRDRAEKVQAQAEKALKDAEKAQKNAEKELKAKQDAQENFEKASKKLNDAQQKYERLKSKGDLSPNDEKKWMKDIKDLTEDVAKYKKRMIGS